MLPLLRAGVRCSLLVTTLLVLTDGPGRGQDAATTGPTLEVVKYKELGKAIRSLKGKVVVVDLWADWCIPCKMAFPHLVELHERYAKNGLVCVSISLDEPKDRDKALVFLKKQKATFPNYLLDEDAAVWQAKFDINGPPAMFVFNKDNRWVAKFDHNDPNKSYTAEDVEKTVRKQLGLDP